MSASNVICESTGGYDQGMNAGAGMRIAYVLQWEDGLESGVMKKVRAQIEEWGRLGANCHVFVLTAEESVLNRDLKKRDTAWLSCFRYRGMFGRFVASGALSRAVDAWQPSLLYSREMALYPPLWSLVRNRLSCLEINSDSRREYSVGASLASSYRRATRRLYLNAFDGFVFVTHELERIVSPLTRTRKTIVIANGISLVRVGGCARREAERALVFIGSPGQRWQGVDRVIQLAGVLRQWRFDIVGYDEAQIERCEEIGSNMRFHGFLDRSQYRTILEKATAGIGTLALERKGLTEASPLKVREYLAYGLPVIVGYQDTDFPEGAPFLFRVQGDVSDWNIDELHEFLDSWMAKRIPREAIAHLDTKVKEAQRLRFLSSLSIPRAERESNG